MRPAVGGKNLVIEMFDTKTQTRNADLFQRLKLVLVDGAGFTFKRDLFGVSPAHMTVQTIDQIAQLFVADIRRSAATKIRKAKLASLKRSGAAVEFVLLN